jgi:3-isopropylmalate/(R)-2-methylmalate dehydratase large subunit
MSIEGGARIGYVNPDQTTYDYIKGREYAPKDLEKALEYWSHVKSDPDAEYDDVVIIDGSSIEPMVTWGINPGQALGIGSLLPHTEHEADPQTAREAYDFMGFEAGEALVSIPIDVAFIGSCTNGRISDLREAAAILKGKRIHQGVSAMVVPGSQQVLKQAESEGLHHIFKDAGVEWRNAGCSMCLAMNPDRLQGNQICASSSNRNFIGLQGSPTGRTLLMSPAMVATAALHGHLYDVRQELLNG